MTSRSIFGLETTVPENCWQQSVASIWMHCQPTNEWWNDTISLHLSPTFVRSTITSGATAGAAVPFHSHFECDFRYESWPMIFPDGHFSVESNCWTPH